MERIENAFKPIDPTKIKSPSVTKKMQVNPASLSSRGQFFLNLVRQNAVSPKNLANVINKEAKTPDKGQEIVNNLVQFSDKKHNPEASPSNSILSKRKCPDTASPLSAKRKRVGFSDPVSSTKEYIVNEEELFDFNSSSARCLTYDDSEELETPPTKSIKLEPASEPEESLEPCVGTTTTEETEEAIESDENTAAVDTSRNSGNLTFKDKNELLDYIKHNLSVDEVLDKLAQVEDPEAFKRKEILQKVVQKVSFREMFEEYLYGGKKVDPEQFSKLTVEQNALATAIVNEISKVMSSNNAIKYRVLDILSEKHSNEFLEHALQENSSNAVCEKLSIKSIVNFLIHKTNVDDSQDNSIVINTLSKELIIHLVTNCHHFGQIVDDKEITSILMLLFKNRQKIDVFDVLHEFLRNML